MIAQLQADLSAISQEINDAVSAGKPWEHLRQRFTATGQALVEAIDAQELTQARAAAALLHRAWFFAEYRAAAVLNEVAKLAELRRASAEQAEQTAEAYGKQEAAGFYRHAAQLHGELAAALERVHTLCSAMTLKE